MTARKIQKEISQDLATGKFGDLQKHIDNFQRSFPGGFSREKIDKMVEELQTNRQENSSAKNKKEMKPQKNEN